MPHDVEKARVILTEDTRKAASVAWYKDVYKRQEPDIRTSDEAKAYLTSLRRILSYIGVSDCKMRCV